MRSCCPVGVAMVAAAWLCVVGVTSQRVALCNVPSGQPIVPGLSQQGNNTFGALVQDGTDIFQAFAAGRMLIHFAASDAGVELVHQIGSATTSDIVDFRAGNSPTTARFHSISSMSLLGVVLISDFTVLRTVTVAPSGSGVVSFTSVTSIAGSKGESAVGNGNGIVARMPATTAVCLVAAPMGNVVPFVAAILSHREYNCLRLVRFDRDRPAAVNTSVGSFAGACSSSATSESKDGTGVAAQFNRPGAMSAVEDLLYVLDGSGRTLRRVKLTGSNVVTTVMPATTHDFSLTQFIGVRSTRLYFVAATAPCNVASFDTTSHNVSWMVAPAQLIGGCDAAAAAAGTFTYPNDTVVVSLRAASAPWRPMVFCDAGSLPPEETAPTVSLLLPPSTTPTTSPPRSATTTRSTTKGGSPAPTVVETWPPSAPEAQRSSLGYALIAVAVAVVIVLASVAAVFAYRRFSKSARRSAQDTVVHEATPPRPGVTSMARDVYAAAVGGGGAASPEFQPVCDHSPQDSPNLTEEASGGGSMEFDEVPMSPMAHHSPQR